MCNAKHLYKREVSRNSEKWGSDEITLLVENSALRDYFENYEVKRIHQPYIYKFRVSNRFLDDILDFFNVKRRV